MQKEITKLIKKAVKSLQKKETWSSFKIKEIILERPKSLDHGDWTTNLSFQLAKELRKSPIQISQELVEELNLDNQNKELFEKIEAVAGYVNFSFSKKYLQDLVIKINKEKENFGNSEKNKGRKVNNEFISANPTGPVHLGNGRGGFLGDVIGKVLQKTGAEVINEYYVNDAGEQISTLGHSVLLDDEAVYAGDYINELNKKLQKLEIDKTDVKSVGYWAADEILENYIKKTVIEEMKIKFDSWISERRDIVETKKVDEALKVLKDKNLTFKKDGATWLKTTKFGDDKDRVLVKENGDKTYFASDCGYILNKIERGFTNIIEIWGADHHGYISRFEAACRALGFQGDLKFLIVQLVKLRKNGKEFRMSKRAGNVVYINELIDEVGIDVVRFFFLMYRTDSHMDFDLDLAKEKSNNNPVFYVQYAHARICGILDKSNLTSDKEIDLTLLTHEKELDLIRTLIKFPELLNEISTSYEINKIPQFAINIADKFHSFYNQCKVVDEENVELSLARLELIKSVKIVLKNVLDILGVGTPEKM